MKSVEPGELRKIKSFSTKWVGLYKKAESPVTYTSIDGKDSLIMVIGSSRFDTNGLEMIPVFVNNKFGWMIIHNTETA
jgi:hypothetical protein